MIVVPVVSNLVSAWNSSSSCCLVVLIHVLPYFFYASLAISTSVLVIATVRGGKVSQWPKGVSFVCEAAASLKNGPGVTRYPNFNVAAASSRFLDAKHMNIRVYARIYSYMRIYAYVRAYTRICGHIHVFASAYA